LKGCEVGRILWRCRRGTKELDVLLERYVRQAYAGATEGEKAALARILELPDPVLSDYLFGHAVPDDPQLAALIKRIATHRH
jgi:antitoxin CptB